MLNVLPKVIIEARDDPAVAAIVGANPATDPPRVAGFEPDPGWLDKPYKAFLVLTLLDSRRHPRLPVQFPTIGGRAYGRTQKEAYELYMAVSDAFHQIGPRLHGNGLGIYASQDDVGGTQGKDPDSAQPVVNFIVSLVATTQVVA